MPPISDADIKLMLAMIASAENMKTDNEELARLIGGGVSANGMRQRVHKIKKMAKTVAAGEDPVTSTGDGTKATLAAKTTPAKRKGASNLEEDGDDDEEMTTPAKKRTLAKRNGTPAKARGAKGRKKGNDEDDIKSEKDHDEEQKAEDIQAEEDASLQVDGASQVGV